MFEKLLANLPYNPGIVRQFSFYARRMRREESLRRLGLVFIVLAFFVQFFAVISPPVSTSAYSDNDMVDGGIAQDSDSLATAQTSVVGTCRNNVKNYEDVLNDFGITCADLNAGSVTKVEINSKDHNGNLYSMGWKSYGFSSNVPFNLAKVSETLYARPLSVWDTGSNVQNGSSYWALKFTAVGNTWFILFGCGNLVSIGIPAPIPTPPPTPPKPTPPKPTPPKPTPPKPVVPPCEAALSSDNNQACVVPSKTAANLTENITDANNTTAQPNDLILYTLHAHNIGKTTVKGYKFSESISDVLDYADVVDLHKGTLNTSFGTVSWPAVNIGPGQSVSEEITVKVKNPIPQLPPDPADPGHYDHVMTNVYGNVINIKVPGNTLTPVVTASTTLVNTGPGSSLIIAGAIAIVAGYFFARSRLLVDESMIAVQETNSGGL